MVAMSSAILASEWLVKLSSARTLTSLCLLLYESIIVYEIQNAARKSSSRKKCPSNSSGDVTGRVPLRSAAIVFAHQQKCRLFAVIRHGSLESRAVAD